jgi:hypothetical protein
MNLYQAVTISIKHPETGKVFELELFCVSPMTQKEYWEIFNSDHKFEDVILAPKISQPLEPADIAAFQGFKEFIEALEAEGAE